MADIKDLFKFRGKKQDPTVEVTDDGLGALVGALEYVKIRTEEAELVKTIKAATLSSMLDEAASGDCGAQAKFLQDMLEKDAILNAHLGTRKLAVLACNMRLIPKDGKIYEDAKDDRYTELWDMLQRGGFYDLCSHLLDAFWQGYGISVIDWEPGAEVINGFLNVHPTNIRFDLEGNPALITADNESGDPDPLSKWHPNQFITHYSSMKPDIPCKNGMGRSLSWLFFFFKHEARKSWVRFLEKFGIPFLIGKMSTADFGNETLRKKLAQQLKKLASDGAVVCTEEQAVDAVTVAGHHNRIHEEFIRRIDECYALAILGQVGSSLGEPGRLGNNEQQQDVRQDRREADCRMLMTTINTQLIEPWWQFNNGNIEDCPIFVMDFMPPKDKQRFAVAVKDLRAAGYAANADQLSYEFGLELEEKEPTAESQGKTGGPKADQ